jgi:hypothetical protein
MYTCKVSVIVKFKPKSESVTNFNKNPRYSISRKCVQQEPSCSMWTDEHEKAKNCFITSINFNKVYNSVSYKTETENNNNTDNFTTNSDIHSINTRHKSSLYPPLLRLTKYQKGVYYTGVKIYNCLPLKIKELSGKLKHFKTSVKKFLLQGSFYTME